VESLAVVEVRIQPKQGMQPAEIAEKIKQEFPDQVIEVAEFRDQVSVIIKRDRIFNVCKYLHDDALLSFDHLKDLCGVDYLNKKEVRFEVVYTLYSIRHHHMIRLRAEVPEKDPTIQSVTPIWAGANWHERECFDMFGITFKGHPDMRRILMPEDWEGHPLRKDYPLKGPDFEHDWKGFTEVVERSKELSEFEWEG
jgi:NADH-quinone oxidoreductase subunit C